LVLKPNKERSSISVKNIKLGTFPTLPSEEEFI